MRRLWIALAVTVALATAGCVGAAVSDGDLVFESGETTIENGTLAEEGYELQRADVREFNTTIGGEGGNATRLVVRNHVASYGLDTDLPAGVGTVRVGVVTTPDASVAGRSVNPLLRMDTYEPAFRFLPETDRSGFEKHDNYTVRPFDEPANVTVFATETDSPDAEPEAFVHVLQVPSPETGDLVIAYATYPNGEAERESIERLFSAFEYRPPEGTGR